MSIKEAFWYCFALFFVGVPLWCIAVNIHALAYHFLNGTTKTVDVERANVYGKHLGEKLRG